MEQWDSKEPARGGVASCSAWGWRGGGVGRDGFFQGSEGASLESVRNHRGPATALPCCLTADSHGLHQLSPGCLQPGGTLTLSTICTRPSGVMPKVLQGRGKVPNEILFSVVLMFVWGSMHLNPFTDQCSGPSLSFKGNSHLLSEQEL